MHIHIYIHTHTYIHRGRERDTQSLSHSLSHTRSRSRSRALSLTHAANYSGLTRAKKNNSFRFLFHETRRILFLALTHSLTHTHSLSRARALSLSHTQTHSSLHRSDTCPKFFFLLLSCFVHALSLELSAAFPVNRLGKQKVHFEHK